MRKIIYQFTFFYFFDVKDTYVYDNFFFSLLILFPLCNEEYFE